MPKCFQCGGELSPDRISALEFLGKPEKIWNCVNCSSQHDSRVRGIYLGASGVSPLKIVSNLSETETIWNKTEKESITDFSYRLSED